MDNKVRIAVIGCGSIACGAHLPAYASNSDCEIVYTVDIIKERAQKAMQDFKAKEFFTDYKELLKRQDYDAVSICTPNSWHDIMSIDFLNAGKAVLCEKPAAKKYADVEKMLAAAKATGNILNIGVCVRFDEALNRIKNLISSGALGELYHIESNFKGYRNIPGIGGDFTKKAVSGGGVLIDWGIHHLDAIIYAAGITDIKTVSAEAYNKIGKNPKEYLFAGQMWGKGADIENGVKDVEEYITGLIRTDKCGITFTGAWARNIAEDEMYMDFLGTKGGVRYKYCDTYSYYHDIGGTLYTSSPSFTKKGIHKSEIDDFVNCVKTKTNDSRAKIDKVMLSCKLLDALYRSAEEQTEIKM